MVQEIYLIDNKNELKEELNNIFKNEKDYKIEKVTENELSTVLKNIPSLIIINEDNIDSDAMEVCRTIKSDEDNSITPIIVITSNKEHEHKVKMLELGIAHYIRHPIEKDYLYYTIINVLKLLYINRRVSPLTGLPGNVQIQAEIKKRFLNKESFSMLYFDLDNFKAYNDVYGFLKGDEIIKLTARIITKNVHSLEEADVFVGHIGGDDFVAIVDGSVNHDNICQNIIAEFDKEILKYFNDDDIERGYVEVCNRKGVIEEFPLTSISIGVVVADKKRFTNILEIGEIGAQVKHLAKTTIGSSYAIDRREI